MITKTIKLIAFSLLVIITASSCKKEKVKGCMDPQSVNYNSAAEEDDNSCRYEGRIVFWYDATASAILIGDGATALTYYVDGVIVGSSATSVYYPSAPNCGQNGSITVTKDLGSSKIMSATYSVKDQTGYEYFSGTVNFNANTCSTLQLN